MSKLLVRKRQIFGAKESEIGTKEKCVKKSYISIFQCSHSATFHSHRNAFIFLIISGLQKVSFLHPSTFHLSPTIFSLFI